MTALTAQDLPVDEVGTRHELIDGGLLVTPHAPLEHQRLVMQVNMALVGQIKDGHNYVLPSCNVFDGEGTLVIPDVVVITDAAYRRGGLGVGPQDLQLVVEVESSSTRRRDRTLKRDLYAEWNVPYWLVNPAEQTITRYGDSVLSIDENVMFWD